MIKDITDKNIIFFGCGAVQKCILHYLDKYFKVDPNKMIIIDLIKLVILVVQNFRIHTNMQT